MKINYEWPGIDEIRSSVNDKDRIKRILPQNPKTPYEVNEMDALKLTIYNKSLLIIYLLKMDMEQSTQIVTRSVDIPKKRRREVAHLYE